MTKFNEEIAKQIADEMSNGKSIHSLCEREDMPSCRTVMGWLARGRQEDEGPYADFFALYQTAQELRAEYYADRIIELSEDQVPDEVIGKGNSAVHAWSNRQKLMADNIKWVSSRLLSKRYGDKIQHTGADDGPIITQIERVIVEKA